MEDKFLNPDEELTLDRKFKKEIDLVRDNIYQTTMDFHNYVFPKYINNYKKYLGFVAERYGSIAGWQSNINYPMVSAAIDQMYANIFDFGYEIGISEEGLKSACRKAFDFRNVGKNVLGETTKEALIVGKGYARDYFIKEQFSEKFFDETISYDIKMPSMQYISVFDVMYDRSKGIDKSSYKIIRTFVSGDKIKSKILPLLTEGFSKEKTETINKKVDSLLEKYKESFGNRFSMFDYNPVKALTATTLWMNSDTNNNYYSVNICNSKKDLLNGVTLDDSIQEDSKNYFLNNNKSTYELVEYFTSTEKFIFINGYLMYRGKIKYNLSQIREVKFNSIPGTGNATGMADKLTGHQDLQNTLWNAFVDNIKLLLGPMFKVTGNVPMAKNGTIDFKAFRAMKANGANDIQAIQLGEPSFAPVNFMQMNEAAAIKESGMDSYISGGGGAIERTAAGVDLKFNQYKSRLTPLTDSIDQMMGDLIRSWVVMFLKFYTKEELEKFNILISPVYEDDEKGNSKFKTFTINGIDIKDILDESKISFTYNSLDKASKEASRDMILQNFQFMIQYIPQSLNMEEMGRVFAGKDFDPLNVLKSGNLNLEGNTMETEAPIEEIPEDLMNTQPEEQGIPTEIGEEQLLEEMQKLL